MHILVNTLINGDHLKQSQDRRLILGGGFLFPGSDEVLIYVNDDFPKHFPKLTIILLHKYDCRIELVTIYTSHPAFCAAQRPLVR